MKTIAIAFFLSVASIAFIETEMTPDKFLSIVKKDYKELNQQLLKTNVSLPTVN